MLSQVGKSYISITNILVIYCPLLVFCSICCTGEYIGKTQRKCGRVYLTVSSLEDTYLELNWINKCNHPLDVKPDIIALFDKDPRDRNEESPAKVKIRASDYPSAYYRTKVKFGHPWLPGNWEYHENLTQVDPGRHCFPYWIVSYRDNEIIDSRCLGIEPTWMNDNRISIGVQRIGTMFIPGTHNSGAFSGVPKFLESYILNQDRNVWTQLVFGIRYLDFRIGYYENEGFFINHDLVRITELIPILREVRKFIELAPKEVVVLDFHRFPYPSSFSVNLHNKLVSVVYQELGHLALPPSGLQAGRGPSLNEIWAQNKSLIICYAHRETARDYPWLWNPLQQHWGNTRSTNELKSFLSKTIKEHHTVFNPMWALMAELTPQPLDLLFRTNRLRKLANDINSQVTMWFRDEWSQDVNVVATDFFLGNDIVNVAIEANRNR